MEDFARTCLLDEYEMRMEFESRKRELQSKKPRHSADTFYMKLPSELKDMWEEKTDKKVQDMLNEQSALNNATFKKGRLYFNADIVREYFREVMAPILQYINDMLGDERHAGVTIDSLILVGGFAESRIVVDAIRNELKPRGIPVVRPHCTELAVLNGAVLVGHMEDIITSRILCYTYGIGMIMEYSADTHVEDKCFEAGGKLWARDVFRKHVTRGDKVKLGEWVSLKEYYPMEEDQHVSTVYVYASVDKNPRYTTDNGCKFVGKLDVTFSETSASRAASSKRRQRKAVGIDMNFGGTELKIKVVDKLTGHKYNTSFKLI